MEKILMQVAVSIVSFNTENYLKGCLNQLKNQKACKLKVFVLDNNSEDNSVKTIENNFPNVKLTKSAKNLGFSRGQNLNLKKINDEYVLILNPDTEIPKDAIFKMTEFIKKNPECGIASCVLINKEGKVDSNGGDFPFGLALISWLFNLEPFLKEPNFHRTEENYYEKERLVDWVGGTFMIVRQEVFETIGYFNENYFMYFEDVEFCFRAKKTGYKIMLNPEIKVKHVSGASSKNSRFTQWKGEFQGLIRFYGENFGPPATFFIRILVYIAIILRIFLFFLKGRRETAINYGKVLFNV